MDSKLRSLVFIVVLQALSATCRQPPRVHPVHSIAVETFTPIASDQASHDLAAGLSNWISLQLVEISDLYVAPRAAIRIHERQDLSVQQIGSRLGVAFLLRGQSVVQGARLGVSLQLLDTATSKTIWQQEFSAAKTEIFDMQREAMRALSMSLSLSPTRAESARLDSPPTGSLKAWDYFLQAEAYLTKIEQIRAVDFAVDLFERAARLDPRFALARAELSKAHWYLHIRQRDETLLNVAAELARSAIDLDRELRAGHLALIRVRSCSQGRNDLSRVSKPDDAARSLALDYRMAGELEKAEECLRVALDIDPEGWRNWLALGRYLLFTGRLEEAADAFEQAAGRLDEPVVWALEGLTTTRLKQGEFAAATVAYERMNGATSEPITAASIASAYSLQGRLSEAEKAARVAVQLDPASPRAHESLGDLLFDQDRHAESAVEYETALDLLAGGAEAVTDEGLQVLQAVLLAKANRCEDALPLTATLRRHLPESARLSHDLAVASALCGDREMTLESLGAAIRSGYPPEQIETEKAFHWLTQDPEFSEVLTIESSASPRP